MPGIPSLAEASFLELYYFSFPFGKKKIKEIPTYTYPSLHYSTDQDHKVGDPELNTESLRQLLHFG
jgi:hypothetical protein